MKCEYGLCLCCETEICDTCKTCGAKKPNASYTEVTLKLSNKSSMVVAVCVDCVKDVYELPKETVMQAVKDAWVQGLKAKNISPEQMARHLEDVKELSFVD